MTSHRSRSQSKNYFILSFSSNRKKKIRNIPLVNMIFKKSRYKYREGAKINDGAPQ